MKHRSYKRTKIGLTVLLIALVSILFFLMMGTGLIVPMESTVWPMSHVDDYAVGGVQGEVILTQTFKPEHEFSKIGVKMATYARVNSGYVNFKLFSPKTGEILFEKAYPAELIVDNDFNEFKIGRIIPKSREELAFELSGATADGSQGAGVWASYQDAYKNGTLTLDEYTADGDIVFYLGTDQRIDRKPQIILSSLYGLAALTLILAYAILISRLNRKI